MHSHHSHSGDYISHAVDTLESIIETAESKGFTHFCLTEHMPRLSDEFLYPEEIAKDYTYINLIKNFEKYLKHAHELQQVYNRREGIKILVGFEVEGLEELHIQYAKELMEKHPFVNMSVGSVHYAYNIPIDFSKDLWIKARDQTPNKTSRALYANYFNLQYKVITELKPTVIGHFDLIRLFAPLDELDPTTNKLLKEIVIEKDWPDIWDLIVRNIKAVKEYGGLFELNSAAIRKGWDTPYPKRDICKAIKKFGDGKFCLSDDSHGKAQVGLNFHKVWNYVRELDLEFIYYLDIESENRTIIKEKTVEEMTVSSFWDQYE